MATTILVAEEIMQMRHTLQAKANHDIDDTYFASARVFSVVARLHRSRRHRGNLKKIQFAYMLENY